VEVPARIERVVEVSNNVNTTVVNNNSVTEEVKEDVSLSVETDYEVAVEPEQELDDTSEVLKRYPTYSPKLAMMMAKSKQNNSSLSDKATVELKERAKDMKTSLPRSEIRDFIDSKLKRN